MKLMYVLIFVFTGFAINAQTVATLDAGSKLNWAGGPIVGQGHEGTIDIVKGTILLNADGSVKGGDFTVDMNTIRNADRDANSEVDDLEEHLKAEDFFAVDKYPQAFFSITKVERAKDAKANQFIVTGFLGVRGITLPITFPATIAHEMSMLRVKAAFTFDRTQWGVNYSSKTIFSDLKDGIIADDIAVEMDLRFWKR
jgi:polyisoprenoid-binding protein YceI